MKTLLAFSMLLFSAPALADQPRFQIVINPSVRADTFLLDTLTGRIWLRVCVQGSGINCERMIWQLESVEGNAKK